MTLAEAQAAANELRTALLDNGVQRVSIELQQGVAGSGWGVAPFKRVVSHHIASYPPGTPGLAVVKNGRSDLGGPLANCYGGFDLTARIITLAWANHPGAGGPWSVPGWGTVPKDNGRPYILGWEFEGGYLPYTDEMHDFMARCGAGSLDWLGTRPGNPGPAPVECHDEHKGWAGPRKPDRVGYTTASGRSRIAAVRGAQPVTRIQPHNPSEDSMYIICDQGTGRTPLVGITGVPGGFIGLDPAEVGDALRATNGGNRNLSGNPGTAPFQWVTQSTWDAMARHAEQVRGDRVSPAQQALLDALTAAQVQPNPSA